MPTVKFQATVSNGTIMIPPQHRQKIQGNVRVTLEPLDVPAGSRNLVEELLARPLQQPGFRPMTREEAHAR